MKRNKQHRSHHRALHGSDFEVMDVGTFFVMGQMQNDLEPAGDAFPIFEDTINMPDMAKSIPEKKKDVYGKIVDMGAKGMRSIKHLLRKAG